MSVTHVDTVSETVSRTTTRRRRRCDRVVIEYRWRGYSAPDSLRARFVECRVMHGGQITGGRVQGMLQDVRDLLQLDLGLRLQGDGPLPQWKHQYVGSRWEPLWREVWVKESTA